ncbi:MAG TPA: hypothetical protein VFD42_07575, partial [Chloroflexota bacterium]|nr:hypothetical protein [Chloroflexota bacterium]
MAIQVEALQPGLFHGGFQGIYLQIQPVARGWRVAGVQLQLPQSGLHLVLYQFQEGFVGKRNGGDGPRQKDYGQGPGYGRVRLSGGRDLVQGGNLLIQGSEAARSAPPRDKGSDEWIVAAGFSLRVARSASTVRLAGRLALQGRSEATV